jgi:hypothetical protein
MGLPALTDPTCLPLAGLGGGVWLRPGLTLRGQQRPLLVNVDFWSLFDCRHARPPSASL